MKTPKIVNNAPANNIQKIVNSYLELETGYALLINGKRGIGKTYFVKNKILPQIGTVKVYHDQRKFYKPIYISLYGLNSMDEVYTLFAFELLPFLKSNTGKVSLGIAKMLTRGLLNYNRAGNIDDFIKDVAQTSKSGMDTKDFVLIFDDLDRLSSKISIGEFIGFVNSLVEHDNNKIIIIADQAEVQEQEIYKAVKEKTIGTVIEYTSTFAKTYNEIILEKYKRAGYDPYSKYMQLLKPLIIDLFEVTAIFNLRTLIYFLQHFSKIFGEIYYGLNLDKEEPGELNMFKLQAITRFALAVSIEFKNGQITYTNPEGIDQVDVINAILHNAWLAETFAGNSRRLNDRAPTEPAEESSKSYKEQFVSRYYGKEIYHFYKSIYDFITGGNEFEVAALMAEIKTNIDDRRQRVFRQDELSNLLGYPQVYDLGNDELRAFTAELFEFALNGQFSLDRYLSVFHFMERFPAILKNDPSEVADKLIAAVNQHAANFHYIPMLADHFGVKQEQNNYKFFLKLFQELHRVNEQVRASQNRKIDLDLFECFKKDPQVFYKAVLEQYYERSIFTNWDFHAFFQQIEKMTGNQIRAFSTFLKSRYLSYEMPTWAEREFLQKLLDKINEQVTDEETLRGYVLEGLQENLRSILKSAEPQATV